MTTLTDIRDRLRIDLADPAGDRWDDAALDRHIHRALRDIDNAVPREATTTLPTTAGSRELDISGIDGLTGVDALEYPAGLAPASYPRFRTWAGVAALQDGVVFRGDDAVVFYTAAHELDESGTTLPVHLEDVLATGAAAYAVLERSPGTLGTVTTGGASVPRDFESIGRSWMAAFRELLHHHRRSRVQSSRLRLPA